MIAIWIISGTLAFILLAVVFLIFPAVRRHEDRSALMGLHIAHRGYHDNQKGIPENSLPAFKAAIEYGFAIENDIHLTADGRVVVFHDDTLKRACGVDKKIEECTLNELKQYFLFGSEETIPTLEECLQLIDGRVPLLIEFKCHSLVKCEELCAVTDKILRGYKGKYFIQSFYPTVLRWYRRNRKEVCRGQLASAFKGEALHKRLLGCMLFNFLARPDFVSYEHVNKKYLPRRAVTLLGAFPIGWTFTSQEEINNSKRHFCTYIFEGFLPEKNQGEEQANSSDNHTKNPAEQTS